MPNIYCLMVNNKSLNDKIRDVLLVNAVDMAETSRREIRIRGRGYDGFITSNLESFPYVGMSVVQFEAEVEAEDLGEVKVKFLVRIQDINQGVMAMCKWRSVSELVNEVMNERQRPNFDEGNAFSDFDPNNN